jgi:hypothetical protein
MNLDEDLLTHLRAVTGLDRPRAAKMLDEIRAWYSADLPTWVRRRHGELQRQGLRNREIFPRLQKEARGILVRPDPLSERQIRRIIYG